MPRKTRVRESCRVLPKQASMRPRPDAAENAFNLVDCDGASVRASMRPRPDAAENHVPAAERRRGHWRFNEAAARCRGKPDGRADRRQGVLAASMRPRPDAAENNRVRRRRRGAERASMRPRPDAAENARRLRAKGLEAARASMRPRPDAAENLSDGSVLTYTRPGLQ